MTKQKIAVLFGGVSTEHDVSCVSATSIIKNIPKDKYDVICIGITKKGRWLFYPGDVENITNGTWEQHPDCATAVISPDTLHKGIIKILDDGDTSIQKIDCVFPVLHGKGGEDGTVQGLLELAGIPFVGCDLLSSANCMDKGMTHTVLDANGIKTSPWCQVLRSELSSLDSRCDEFEAKLGYPMFVKPANGGSSIGISKANDREELKASVKHAFALDQKVIVEKNIAAREIECAVLGNDEVMVSEPGEIVSCSDFYDYEAKYILAQSELKIPAPLTDAQKTAIMENAKSAYIAMGCKGLARVDSFLCENGEILINEINTIPGFTSISMYPKLMENMGIPYSELIDKLITIAIERNQ